MKNWKFIQVGNTSHSDKVDVIKRLLAGGWSVQDIYDQLKTEGYEVEKNFIEKLKTGNSEAENRYTIPQASKEYDRLKAEYQKTKSEDIKKQIDDLKETIRYETMMATSYFDQLDGKKKDLMYNEGKEGKVHYWNEARKNMEEWKKLRNRVMSGNESIDKQEWSMFKGLTKKAESEVGNEDIPTEQDLKNWIRMSQQDMKDAQREMEKNKPLGHPDSYREEKYGRAKVKYDEAAKAIKKMEEELRQGKYKKVGNNKVGNVLPPSGLYAKLLDEICEKEGIDSNKAREKYGQYSIEQWEKLLGRKIGNGKVYNARSKEQLLADVRELTKYIKDNPDRPCEKEKRLLGEAKEELDKRYGVIVGNFKTGKSKLSIGEKVSLYGVKGTVKSISGENGDNIYGEPVIEFESEDGKTKQVPEHYLVKVGNADTVSEYNSEIQRLTKKAEQLRRMGQGRSAIEIEKQIEKLGRELREIGNSKYGSKEDIISHLDTDLYDIHKNMGGKDRPIFFYVSGLQKKGYDIGTISKFIKDIGKTVERLKTGNETLGQWAKAKPRIINGLKRARNAMVKNAMSVSDLERRIKENEKYIKSLQGKTVDGDGWPAKDAIQEAQDEIDMMKSRIAELTKQGNKKVCNLDTVEEGDYVTVRFQGELVDGVVRKVQGTQALVTIDNTDVWFPIRSLKEST